MNENVNNEIKDLKSLTDSIKNTKVNEILPGYKTNSITDEQIVKMIGILSISLGISKKQALSGMYILFLKGAINAGTPNSLSISLDDNKTMSKRNLIEACISATSTTYLRRIAEKLAVQIGDFAFENDLKGELANRINNKLKADSGGLLNTKESAYCSSFSQNIDNLSELTGSERLQKLLAEDYQKRFEGKSKSITTSSKDEHKSSRRK